MTTLQPCYVLHTRRYRESSQIVELLTRDHGRLGVMARGAPGGKAAASLQPFSPLLAQWRGSGELPSLIGAESAGPALHLQGRALYCGLYVNELLLRLTERADPHSQLFSAYVGCLLALASAGNDNAGLEPVLRRFELDLLDDLGLGMQLSEDELGQPLDPEQRYHYDIERGPRLATASTQTVSGASLLALAQGVFDSEATRQEARALMRRILAVRLGGKELKSRELFR